MALTGRFSGSGSGDRRGYSRVLDAVRLTVSKAGEKQNDSGEDSSVLHDGPTHKVSLSGSGIAFAHNQLLQPGDRVNLQLTLYPAETELELSAMIVSVGHASGPVSGGEYAARAVFSDIESAMRKQILDHINYVRSKM